MNYNRFGLYQDRKKNPKKSGIQKKQSVDWINVFLVVLLLVVAVLFIVT